MSLRDQLRAQLPQGARMLVVTAVEAERDAILRGLSISDGQGDSGGAGASGGAARRITIEVVGVGPAAAAGATSRLLALAEAAGEGYAVAVSAGIAGGFAGRAEPGSIVLAGRSIAADLGSDSQDGFVALYELGFGTSTVDADPDLLAALRARLPAAVVGDVLTVSTVTGTRDRATELIGRHPLAVAEAMEGFGVAIAAVLAGIAYAEIRTVANPVGPRDRSAWRLDDALAALATAATALDPVLDAMAAD